MNITGATEVGGVFEFELVRDGKVIDKWSEHNLVTNQGLNHLLNVGFSGDTAASAWYVGLFNTAHTPAAGDTAATIATTAGESSAYDEVTRPLWVEVGASNQSITNSASKATFTINAPTTIYGAFLISDSTKAGTNGTLFAVSRFPAARTVIATDQLLVTYTLQAQSSV